MSAIVCSAQLFAQVPVSKEPYHPIVFENSKVRILNVRLSAGDTTQYHLHSTPSVFIFFTKTKTGSQLINKEPFTGTSTPGHILFENLDTPNTRTHRVWNMDTSTFHVIDIELLSTDTGFDNEPLMLRNIVLKIDTPWVRAYAISLQKNQAETINKNRSAFILVSLNNGKVLIAENGQQKKIPVREGTHYWISHGTNFSFKNEDDKLLEFVLVELQ